MKNSIAGVWVKAIPLEQRRFLLRGLESLLCSGAYSGIEEVKIKQLETLIRKGKLKQ